MGISRRAKRLVATAAASAVLVGGGTAMGVAMTGGASAAVNPPSSATMPPSLLANATVASTTGHGRCAKIAQRLRASGHTAAAQWLASRCDRRLHVSRLGGEYGQVTFRAAKGSASVTAAFERGTIESVAGSAVSVRAANGTTWTWQLTSSTVIRQNRQKTTTSKLTTGEQVLAVGTVANGTDTARLIRIRKAG
ncbi:MAG TPA: hypothetical protein VGI58_11995 [Streptosporangiaceae bacterium]|jgi:hypothetical protein